MNDDCYSEIKNTLSKITMQTSIVARSLFSDSLIKEMTDSIIKMQSTLCSSLSSLMSGYQLNFIPLIVQIQKAIDSIPKDWQNVDTTQIIEDCVKDMFENKWFPSAVCDAGVSFIYNYRDIAKTTRVGSKHRGKLLDKLVFSCYGKDYLKETKRKWKSRTTSAYQRRTLLEALRAYERKEYATTIIILSTFWQGLIYEKTNNEDDYRKDKETKEYAHQLMNDQFFHEFYEKYFDDYIYYKCSNANEVKEGVPGRHAIVHNWYKNYPSKKEALNAIFFTNTLIEAPKLQNNANNTIA